MIRTGIKRVDVERLKDIFAYLTTDGWQTPQWLLMLEAACSDS